jgi:DNA-binding SARP family transcriptional activator
VVCRERRSVGGYRRGGCGIEGAWRLRKSASVVKLLALAPGHRLHRDQLLDRLWPDLALDAAGGQLRKALHQARECWTRIRRHCSAI